MPIGLGVLVLNRKIKSDGDRQSAIVRRLQGKTQPNKAKFADKKHEARDARRQGFDRTVK